MTQLNNSEIDRVALYCLDCTLRPRLTIRTTAHRRNEMKKKRSWIKSFGRREKKGGGFVVAPSSLGRRMTIARDAPRERIGEERTVGRG